ncbi:hypothetical protein BO78DRAFT_340353 [Aspergillus sclerotiicarbonarius CBS 121057]|uniref:Aminoglycoside phosphotransferase domain-containing protein n=1 Tax=Aspergillus sclerotiicarbonarius (strain CBS 121057 / IBT 28362) TaxID=1448318 RepID=A0A319EJU5_ASPSB|nr:hypothetical protein BO78DRAFT_340353 [Aspergillus sclerotiicarbonarius CBS 121057]
MSIELSNDRFSGYRWTPVSKIKGTLGPRVEKFLEITNWDALTRRASKERNGMECKLLPDIGAGWNHLIRILEFVDQVQWVARLQMPHKFSDDHEPTMRWGKVEREYMTIRLVQEKSRLPVPKVYVCEDDPQSSVGVPFMFMECLKGNAGIDLCWDIPPEHKLKIYTALAEAQVELFRIGLPKIGMIIGRNEDGSYQLGPIPGIGGPFDTATEYFKAWSATAEYCLSLEEARQNAGADAEELLSSASKFRTLINDHAEWLSVNNTGPFPLRHGDFGHNNVVFDDEYNMVGVIDWESTSAVPCVRSAEFPLCLSMTPPAIGPPCFYDENGYPKDADLRERLADREHYIEIVKQIEEERGLTEGYTLSSALQDSRREHISYAMGMYRQGFLGFYSKLLEGVGSDEDSRL